MIVVHRARWWLPTVVGWALALVGLPNAPSAIAGAPPTAAERHFVTAVLPVLRAKCFACHGEKPDDIRGEYNMLTRASLLAGGESGDAAVVPGQPDESPLVHAIRWEDLEMPPKENDRLTQEQITAIVKWIADGAPWPDAATIRDIQSRPDWSATKDGEVVIRTSGGLASDWTNRKYRTQDVWAILPLRSAQPPRGAGHPIDAFLDAQLKAKGLTPAPQADPVTLVRRAYYDLLGLPPTSQQIAAFTAAWSRDAERAWSDLLDELLASPHYGERWAQHWLDVVRYADTSGYSNDFERSNAWRYRDYVIRSLNEDKPYRQFVMEQLAGDELADLSARKRTGADDDELARIRWEGRYTPQESEWIVAAGFLRMGPWEHTAMSPTKVSRQAYLDDLVNSIGQTFLSTTLRCCKCHDHKFDPIPTRDYYRIYAAVATTQPVERVAPFLESENRGAFDEERRHVERLLAFAKQEQDRLYAKRETAAKQWYAERGRSEEYVPFEERRKSKNLDKPPRFVGLTTAEQGQLKVREQDVRIWTRRLERFQPLAQSVFSGGGRVQASIKLRLPDPSKKWQIAESRKLPETFLLSGGNVFSPLEPVRPGVLSALHIATQATERDAGDPYALPESLEGRRLALAQWIARPDNALALRSIVNRVWHYHFGQGIAGNPNNFGATGKKPTHPELLDWLAREFVRQGWSLKRLHKLIMTSQAYRRSTRHPAADKLAEVDPNGELLAVFRPRRLTAEEIRDSMLAWTGELNPELGGLPVRPEINMEVALAPRMIQFSLAPAWQPSRTPDRRNRRSIYAYRVRGLAIPFMEVFNQPSPNDSCERRDAPSVTPQVFTMLNGDFVTHRSIAFALRLQREAETPEQQIARAFAVMGIATPSDQTLNKLLAHYKSMVQYHSQHVPKRIEYPTRVTRSLVEEFSGDAFEYEELLDIYEDYVRDPDPADVSPEARALADICLLLLNSHEATYVY